MADGFCFYTETLRREQTLVARGDVLDLMTEELDGVLRRNDQIGRIKVWVETGELSLFPTDYAATDEDFGQLYPTRIGMKRIKTRDADMGLVAVWNVAAETLRAFDGMANLTIEPMGLGALRRAVKDSAQGGEALYVEAMNGRAQIALGKEGKPVWTGMVRYGDETTAIYEVANIFGQMELSQKETRVTIGGVGRKQMAQWLNPYIAKIERLN